MQLYKTPFSAAYWKTAAAELKNYRALVFSALMIAACIVLSHCKIPLGENLSLSVTFLARALCALVCGPIAAVLYGFVEDILGYILKPSGPFFPGYTLTTMLGCFWYALFFFRARITITRVLLATSDFFVGWWWLLLLIAAGLGIAYMVARRSVQGRKAIAAWSLTKAPSTNSIPSAPPHSSPTAWPPC